MKKVKRILFTMLCVLMVFSSGLTVQAAAKLNKKTVTITTGKTYKLQVRGTKKKAKWTSSNKVIATVNQKGLIKAKKPGKCYITAKIGKKKYKCTVTVKALPVVLKVSAKKVTLTRKNKTKKVLITYKNGSKDIPDVWYNNVGVIKVSWGTKVNKSQQYIEIEAISEGTETITVEDKIANKKIIISVTVKNMAEPYPYKDIEAGKGVDKSEIQTYTGEGDDVVRVAPFNGRYVFEITGNAGSDYFGVIPYTASGKRMSSLVNTTERYHGIVYNPEQDVVMLEVKATGTWKIVMKSIYKCPKYKAGETASGSGDSIILLNGGGVTTAYITGNEGSNYFGVIPYDHYGKRGSSLVNVTDPYKGTVLVQDAPWIFEVLSEDDWTIQF